MPTTKMATGYKRPNGEIQVAVRIPKTTFDHLQKMAVEQNTSINKQMRSLLEAAVKASKDKP
jgi:hypothetical protein